MSRPVNATVPDEEQRRRALDVRRSFIVQAPAGSGKTELLIQRYLALLAEVERPEEIAAITFTRKAAAEMRQRVVEALGAASDEAPAEAHARETWQRARRALEQDTRQGWAVLDNPARLRIQTIDALCASLTRQMPVLSAFGSQPESVDDASSLYAEAARATLALIDQAGETGDCIAQLLAHVDNDTGQAESLIVDMLARRDHWLRHLGRGLDREALQRSLGLECRDIVARINPLLPAPLRLSADAACEECHALADRLLTKDGDWRKRSPEAQALAEGEGAEALRRAVLALRKVPPACYSERQWEALGAIMKLLPLAVAELQLVFAARGQADFVEIAQRSLAALGEEGEPTDLLLALDYRIRHLLVDEFQDTSYTQYRLLQTLTTGWEPDDGRTLFLVGDPMQSIYRFREADVGLFLKARREGIGPVSLEPLTLSANFRSAAEIVRWVNTAFRQVMPVEEDIATGAVTYAPSVAMRATTAGAVNVHAFFDGDIEAEAMRVASLVAAARAEDRSGSIAVLVRSRGHLDRIVPALRRAGERIRAIEIEPLGDRPVIRDLLALTRALLHPADRLSWLAVLRAPWCGLTLADLHALAGPPPAVKEPRARAADDLFPETLPGKPFTSPARPARDTRTVWQLLHDEQRLSTLSPEGWSRLERIRAPLKRAVGDRLRGSLRERVEHAWLALGGPACVADDTALDDVEIYFDFLDRREDAGEVSDIDALEQGVEALFALPDVQAGPGDVQILTIHKSKGLEFDTVIVPALGAAPRQSEPRLFLWMDRADDPRRGLLLAPVREAGAGRDAVYDYLAALEKTKQANEDGRLLYVAATRAKKRLHLLGDVRRDPQGEPAVKPPAGGSLLEKLWPVLAQTYELEARDVGRLMVKAEASVPDQTLRRLALSWRIPEPPADAAASGAKPTKDTAAVEFSWAGEVARHVGSVVHRWLQRMADDALEGWTRERIETLQAAFRAGLAARGVDEASLDAGVSRVRASLEAAIVDERGRWLLGPQQGARTEYRLAMYAAGERRHLVVDRVFTDAAGRRWIVDYKTSSHEGSDRDAFLDRERERYRAQLEGYLAALGETPDAETRLGLYFPLLAGWRDWRSSS